MEKVRTRDFIYTTDGLYFASTNYIHPMIDTYPF